MDVKDTKKPEVPGPEKPEGVLFETSQPQVHMITRSGRHIIFSAGKKYRATHPEEIALLETEADTPGGVVRVAADQSASVDPPLPPGSNRTLREQQLRDFLTKQPVLKVQGSSGKHLGMASSQDSPLTGGTTPATQRFSQAETIAALKQVRIVGGK